MTLSCRVPLASPLVRSSPCTPPDACARRACLRSAGLAEALENLRVAGRVLVWLLHAANPRLLEAARGSRLQLRGVVALQSALLTTEERCEWVDELYVGCPGLHATMQLEQWRF